MNLVMKVIRSSHIEARKPITVLDCAVRSGYIKTKHGSLPDIDTDFASDRRQDVKEYLERRYGKTRVFSAGTFTTEKIRSVIKDVCRVHKVSVATTNYITAIIEDSADWTELMRTAAKEKKVYDFIQKYPEVFEEILPIMNQPRSAGIHASALIITPDTIKNENVECFDVLPIRKMDNLLVSEISGADIDEIGLLKNDVLGIAELSRIAEMINACNKEYGANISIETIINGDLNEPKIYDAIRKGLTQGIFQLSGDGITRFIKQMKPDNINDLIASVALFRPGPLETGSAQGYIDCKNGLIEPEYLWGTYEILKNTYGYCIYQEQISKVAQKIGNLSLGDGVNLVKALSKKKVEKVRKFKDRYYEGAEKNGCPKDVADRIWEIVEAGAKYAFNLSHATAYGLTAFIGAWLKVHYPIAFYTVLLKWVDKEKLPTLMNEMRELGQAEIVQPNINISSSDFVTDYSTNTIYWSLSRIKQLGAKAVQYIVRDRNVFGEYASLEQFIKRIFKYKLKTYKDWEDPDSADENERCPVNARSVKHLILSGAFDECEHIGSVMERYGLMQKAAGMLGFEVSEKDVPNGLADKHWFWSQQQINIAGIGSIDYQRIYSSSEKPSSFRNYTYYDFRQLANEYLTSAKTVAICATIVEISEKSYVDKQDGSKKVFGKVVLQQNTDIAQVVLWSDSWKDHKECFVDKRGSIVIAVATVKYSEYDEKNVLQINKGAFVINV